MLVTDSGMVIEVRPASLKAFTPIVVTEFGIVIDFKFVQPPKVLLGIDFIELGIFTEVRLVQLLKT